MIYYLKVIDLLLIYSILYIATIVIIIYIIIHSVCKLKVSIQNDKVQNKLTELLNFQEDGLV